MSDWEPMAEFLGSEAARFVGGPFDRKRSWDLFASDVGRWSLVGCGCWAVVDRASGAFVGQVGLNRAPHFPEPEIGWLTFPAYQRLGYAREAALSARAYAREALGWTTCVSYIDPGNEPSIALARSIGCRVDHEASRVVGEENDLVFRHPAP